MATMASRAEVSLGPFGSFLTRRPGQAAIPAAGTDIQMSRNAVYATFIRDEPAPKQALDPSTIWEGSESYANERYERRSAQL